MNRKNGITAYFFYLITFSTMLLVSCGSVEESPIRKLPYYGERDTDENGDTLYHEVGNFSLKNQEGEVYSHNDLEGKVYVANFFFTSCPNICPKMMTNLKRFLVAFKDNDEIRMISFTVDPDRDTVPKMKKYADKFGIDAKKWNLLTGDKETIYELGVYGYLLSAQEDALAEGGFLHSQQIILVDRDKHIRGSYDALKQKEIDRLIEDTKVLLNE